MQPLPPLMARPSWTNTHSATSAMQVRGLMIGACLGLRGGRARGERVGIQLNLGCGVLQGALERQPTGAKQAL